jgi:ABC-type phosphate transport system substrate-binding protein
MKTRRTLLAALLLSAAVGSWSYRSRAGGESTVIAVIVNGANPTGPMSAGELRQIFQTNKTKWGHGVDATPLNLPNESKLRQEFDEAVLGLDPERAARYWKDRKIRGGARAPKHLPTTSGVLAAVAAEPGAIGYVNTRELNKNVKVVARVVNGKLLGP